MPLDLSQLSEAQLRRELQKREQQKHKGELGKHKGKSKVPSGHARKRATLNRKTKKDEKFEKKLTSKLKQGHRGLAKTRAEIETKRRTRVKKPARGKYVKQVNWIKLSLKYTVNVFGKNKAIGTYTNTIDDFIGIRWNANRDDTWKSKMDLAKDRMLVMLEGTLESNAELASHKFTYVAMKSKNELNKVAKDPTLIKMLGTPKRFDEVKVGGKPIHYKYIPADINEPVDGFTCTDSYLMQEYKKRIPSLCQERLDEIMGKINPAEGRSCKDLDRFCAAYSISHYAIDWKHKCFYKEVRDTRNYKALIYYCVNGHLYPVTDAKTRESITKKSAAKSAKSTAGTNLRSALTEEKTIDRENAQIELFKKPFFEDVPVKKLKNYENCNIFYHKHSLYDMLIQLYVQYN